MLNSTSIAFRFAIFKFLRSRVQSSLGWELHTTYSSLAFMGDGVRNDTCTFKSWILSTNNVFYV